MDDNDVSIGVFLVRYKLDIIVLSLAVVVPEVLEGQAMSDVQSGEVK
ncbi:hypothetical protein KPL47_24500 [Clostridium estertheticum]|nr:hypothetical protein [Clostridium estertheticum]MBU3179434.1 hypothetical protein [Clostridium estertheticum]